MKRLYALFTALFTGSVVCAPFIFRFYYDHGLVCAPRAIVASAVFGAVPLILLTIALVRRNKACFRLASTILWIEVLITPAIMLHRLGWTKFIGDRLPAFFTFEGFAVAQILLISIICREWRRHNSIVAQVRVAAAPRLTAPEGSGSPVRGHS